MKSKGKILWYWRGKFSKSIYYNKSKVNIFDLNRDFVRAENYDKLHCWYGITLKPGEKKKYRNFMEEVK